MWSRKIDSNGIDKDNTFISVNNSQWNQPREMSIKDLNSILKFDQISIKEFVDNDTLEIDPKTLKVKVNSNIFKQNISWR